MKKLMVAALAVAGMSAFAADFAPVAVEKIQMTLKQVNQAKVDSVKYNGFVFWDKTGATKTVVWDKNSKAMIPTNCTETAFGKNVKLKKVYKTVDLGAYDADIFAGQKKSGKYITFGEGDKGYIGYGAGSVAAKADLMKGTLTIKESVSGNLVNKNERMYGTWKLSFDKSTTKNLAGKYTIKDVLVKNKVEFWDL